LLFRFDITQAIDPQTLNGIQITRSVNGVFGDGDDLAVDPMRSAIGAIPNGHVALGDRPNEVVMRFGQTLPDDLYRVTIVGSGPAALLNQSAQAFNAGVSQSIDFRLDLGAQVTAVVPQPVSRDPFGALQQERNVIEVYFNNDDLIDGPGAGTAEDPSLYQLIFTNETATNADDVIYTPSSVDYDPATDLARLTFVADIDQLGSGQGTFRLRIGDTDLPPSSTAPLAPTLLAPSADPGSSYASAHVLGTLGARSQIVSAAIEPQFYGLNLPGSSNEPGHRDIPVESHLLGEADSTDGITTIFFDFRRDYGVDPQGNPLTNGISDAQKQRTREVLELYGRYLGVQFVETDPPLASPSLGFTIATGDLRAIDPTVTTGPGGFVSIAGLPNQPFVNGQPVPIFSQRLAIMDNAENWGNSEFGGAWFQV
ncbi:MAG: hypothetical protein WD176_01855, partial [Pirellulales bacterium]